jgi:O-acetyl-ADP-ribose deacetylase (regulator of RNase III)
MNQGNIMILEAQLGNISEFPAHAVVNAAKESLLGGSGVDGAIHKEAGPQLLEACKALPEIKPGVRCPTGRAIFTKAFDMVWNRYIIHTVGPIYDENDVEGCQRKLTNCYKNSIKLAINLGVDSIAFPAISTGVYGYPLHDATLVAILACMEMAEKTNKNFRVSFVCFDERSFLVYDRILQAYKNEWYTKVEV